MPRKPASFKKTDAVRLIEAARAGGLQVAAIEVGPDGTLRTLEAVPPSKPSNDFDRWEADL